MVPGVQCDPTVVSQSQTAEASLETHCLPRHLPTWHGHSRHGLFPSGRSHIPVKLPDISFFLDMLIPQLKLLPQQCTGCAGCLQKVQGASKTAPGGGRGKMFGLGLAAHHPKVLAGGLCLDFSCKWAFSQ